MQRNEPSACNSPSMLIVLWTQLYLISCTNFAVFLAKGDCQKCALYEKKIKELQEQMRSKDVSLNELMKISMKMEKQISQQVFLLLAILAKSLVMKFPVQQEIDTRSNMLQIYIQNYSMRCWEQCTLLRFRFTLYRRKEDVFQKNWRHCENGLLNGEDLHCPRLHSHCSVFVSIRFWWWKRCPFTVLRFQMNFYENDRRSHCFSKILLIPLS